MLKKVDATTIQVETGIPMPAKMESRSAALYPWATMGVGDSFFVPAPPARLNAKASSVQSAANSWALRNDPSRKFSSRQVAGGVRIWRTA